MFVGAEVRTTDRLPEQQRILLLLLEFPRWTRARHWTYGMQLGIEEGLAANGVDFLTLTAPWFERAPRLVGNRRFDQVWVEVVHTPISDGFANWLADIAPVRVGFLPESLDYSARECAEAPVLSTRKRLILEQTNFLTHYVAVDEHDVMELAAVGKPAFFWPPAVPERSICENPGEPILPQALFTGAIYGGRDKWFEQPGLKDLLRRQPSPERGTAYPFAFDALHRFVGFLVWTNHETADRLLPAYTAALRTIRRRCFDLWLGGLRAGVANVNLPSYVKAYAGRVTEGMAAGRPVISWRIPDRPRTRALFVDGHEILLFDKDDSAELAYQIEHVRRDRAFAASLVNAAQQKIRRFHTLEKRIAQFISWVESAQTPEYW